MAKLPAADPTDPGTICGPLVSARQRDRVEGYLKLALKEGGSFALGGGRPKGSTGVLRGAHAHRGVGNDARVAQEEIFGPVLVVIPFDDDDDAVALANDSAYGLSGSVWSADRERAVGWPTGSGPARSGSTVACGSALTSPSAGTASRASAASRASPGFEEYLEIKSLAEPA